MNLNQLAVTARRLVADHKGLLAADESTGTIAKRLGTIGVESTIENRRDYREILFRTKGLGQYISGAILYDETIRQNSRDGTPLIKLLMDEETLYADQVLEHMSGIDMAREFVNEAWRALRPGGVFFVVVPDYLKEREFFWDIDYTHNFVTTDRRVRQLLYDGGFEMEEMVRSIGVATGFGRNILAAAALFVNIPGVDALSRYLRMEEFLFRVRKNLFETLSFVARKPL